jgi:iron complex outermembrane receptor protein
LKQADFNLNARHEFYENIPTFGISSVVPVKKWFQIKSNVHSTFRRPTLNDLFWRTNATEIAKSEKGWGVELGLLKNIQSTFVDATFEVTSYYRELKDPIIWIPNGVSWIATNFHNGQYAGIQFNGKVSKGYLNQKIALNFGGEWVKAHVKKGFEQPGYAQIFIPDFMGFVGVILDRKLMSYKIDIQHTGNRYIQTDNLAWMPGYRIVNCQVSLKQWQFLSLKNHKHLKCEASVECRNALNTVFQNMPSRPMPGRTFWLNLNIKI